MPLVRIHITEGRSEKELTQLADVVQEVLIETFAARELDRYHIIHEHKKGLIKALDTGLGHKRTDKIVILQITHQRRNRAQKEKMYSLMSQKLEKIGITTTDLIISLQKIQKKTGHSGLVKHNF